MPLPSGRFVRYTRLACAALAAVAAPRLASAIIINGTPAQAETAIWDGVGVVAPVYTITYSKGTGTLVDSTPVLTAAHLVFDSNTQSLLSPSALHFVVNGQTLNVTQVSVP